MINDNSDYDTNYDNNVLKPYDTTHIEFFMHFTLKSFKYHIYFAWLHCC